MIPDLPPPAIYCEAPAPVKLPFDKYKFLLAIKMKEGDKSNPYGICKAVRIQHRRSVKEGTELEFALAHVDWLARAMPLEGLKVDVMNMALCWKSGLTGAVKELADHREVPPPQFAIDLDYAICIHNLYYSFQPIML